jgi:hypothetical protein
MTKVTDAMYEAGMKYLNGRGTAWCVTDLYKAMKSAEAVSEIHAPISHEMEPHCCGCWIIRYDVDGLNAICNECGETRDLIALLAQSPQPEDRLTTKAVLNAMQDHYWDSLEPNRDIVMKHVEGVLRLFEQSHMNLDESARQEQGKALGTGSAAQPADAGSPPQNDSSTKE